MKTRTRTVEIYFQESGSFGKWQKWGMSIEAQRELKILAKLTLAYELRSVELIELELQLRRHFISESCPG
jgi:hypothetical protein